MLWTQRLTVLMLFGVLTSPAPSWGQEGPVDPQSSLLRDIGTDVARFFTSGDTYTILGLGLVTSAALRPLDDDVIASRVNGELYQGRGFDSAF